MTVVHPLKTWDDVQNWQLGEDGLSIGHVALPEAYKTLPNYHRTLVCHDMAGGYLHDKYIFGCNDIDAYRFYHWKYVDMFVYFSHHMVTIPPPCWINAAHIHGTLVLGTFITEWTEGKDICEKLLLSKEICEQFATKLTLIASHYGFDGWLINIENEIQEEEVGLLELFVDNLTKKMHKKIPHSKVIWYDSVIDTGKLKWQDQLNEKNSNFFDVCDGIFLNYCWKDEGLKSSAELAVAKGRPYDVYVGVDVFGRGCYGGGGYATNQAVEMARKHDLSVAIFAQGWVYECHSKDKELFSENEDRFWSLLHEYCPLRKVKKSSAQVLLQSIFCQGRGYKYWSQGNIMSERDWSNMSLQHLQPNCSSKQFQEQDSMSLSEQSMNPYMDDAFHGGSCLKLVGNFESPSLLFRLFETEIEVSEPLRIHYTYKCYNKNLHIYTKLSFVDTKTKCKKHVVIGEKNYKDLYSSSDMEPYIYQPCDKTVTINDWITSSSKVILTECEDAVLTCIAIIIHKGNSEQPSSATALLGLLQIKLEKEFMSNEVILITNPLCKMIASEKEPDKYVVQVEWNFPINTGKYFNIFGIRSEDADNEKRKYLGSTHCCKYLVQRSELEPYNEIEIEPAEHDPFKKVISVSVKINV